MQAKRTRMSELDLTRLWNAFTVETQEALQDALRARIRQELRVRGPLSTDRDTRLIIEAEVAQVLRENLADQ
jgi:hypothetical protein